MKGKGLADIAFLLCHRRQRVIYFFKDSAAQRNQLTIDLCPVRHKGINKRMGRRAA